MKKLFSILMTVMLIFCMTPALASEAITVDIQAVDYQTGKVVSKTYVENELFTLRVDIGIPRFADLSNMELIVEVDGVEIEEPNIELINGRYYINGIVVSQPAAICVKVKDVDVDNASTAEELYEAMKSDRTVSDCYYFYAAQKTESNLVIPKTGDMTVTTGIIALVLIVLASVCLFQTAKRAKR